MGLTDLQVKKLVPQDSRFEVSDGKGLYIRVTPNGVKTWVFRYQFNGRARRLTLGNYPGISLADARERHAQAMQKLQKGADPGVEAQEAKGKLRATPTMTDLVHELWETELKKKRSGAETLRLLKKDVIPLWGKHKVSEIKRRNIVLLLDGIIKRGSPITRNRVHSALTRLFNFAAERGVIEDSPCTRIRKLAEMSRDRVLSDTEIMLLWEALDLDHKKIDMFLTTKMALKLILLTGQRSGEICGMTWAELDAENRMWNIPAQRMKNGVLHIVPFTAMTWSVIGQARQLFGDDRDYVFPSANREGPITPHALSRAILRHWPEMGFEKPFTPHDIRRTVRTGFGSLGIDEFIAERVLGHKLQGMLAVYNRHSYVQEKLAVFQRWEAKLMGIFNNNPNKKNNIISITEARRHVKSGE